MRCKDIEFFQYTKDFTEKYFNMGSGFIERLQEYMDLKGINDNQMTVAADLSIGLLGKLKKNGKGMNSANVEKILLRYTDLSSDWLLTGRGEMLKTPANPLPPVVQKALNPGEGIPLIPIEAMAGALTCEQTVFEYECERYVVPMFKGADFLIPVKGSSMYPKYSSGDIVACQRIPMNDIFFQWNKVYVIDTDQGALIKRIKPGKDKHHVLIVSDNEKYDPFELSISSIHAVALVIGVIRLE